MSPLVRAPVPKLGLRRWSGDCQPDES